MFKKRNVKKSNVEITFSEAPNEATVHASIVSDDDDDDDMKQQQAKKRGLGSAGNLDSDEEANAVLKNAGRLRKKFKGNNGGADAAAQNAEEETESNRVKELIDNEMSDFKYKSNAQLTGNSKELATVYNEIDTDETIDSRAIALKRMEISQQVRDGTLSGDVYRGKNYSTMYTTKSEESIRKSKITGSLGPVRAPANVRMTCRFDYDPSLCKDYHDTGYCVFGDSCLYLHDRGDYKNGQEQEQDWLREQKKKQKDILDGIDAEEDEEVEDITNKLEEYAVPKECAICSSRMRNPVKTLCEHYFCEACALKRYGKEKSCAVCNKLTQGVFADATQALIKLRRARSQEKAKLRKNASSVKALDLLMESDDEDTAAYSEDNQSGGIVFKVNKKKGKKAATAEKMQQQPVRQQTVQERVYIDDSGMEITETVLIDEKPVIDEQQDNDERGESDSNGSDEEQEDSHSGEGNNQSEQEDEDRAAGLAMNQLLKKTNRQRQVFKASASDWVI